MMSEGHGIKGDSYLRINALWREVPHFLQPKQDNGDEDRACCRPSRLIKPYREGVGGGNDLLRTAAWRHRWLDWGGGIDLAVLQDARQPHPPKGARWSKRRSCWSRTTQGFPRSSRCFSVRPMRSEGRPSEPRPFRFCGVSRWLRCCSTIGSLDR